MDNEPANGSMISQKRWPVVLWLSGFLDQVEREAVLGDLTEYGESGGKAIANVLGLVVRRQTAVLLDRKLWVSVALVVLPVSYLLSAISQTTAGQGAVYSWMYLNNWDWALTRNPGFWHLLGEMATNFAIACIMLACWSWSGGFLIGRLPKAILRASRDVFIVLLASSQLSDAPDRVLQLWMYFHGLPLRPRLPDVHAPITANVFYHVFFPWIVLAVLVIWPASSGIRQGNQSLLLGWKMRVVLVTASTVSLLILLIQLPGFGFLFGAAVRQWLWGNRYVMQVLSLLCFWPMLYFIAVGFEHYRRRRSAMAQ